MCVRVPCLFLYTYVLKLSHSESVRGTILNNMNGNIAKNNLKLLDFAVFYWPHKIIQKVAVWTIRTLNQTIENISDDRYELVYDFELSWTLLLTTMLLSN